jgi:hypothetical protein
MPAVRISYGKYKEPSSEEYEQNGDEQRGLSDRAPVLLAPVLLSSLF